jgi:RNA polymerase-binding transcription factor DksA
VIDVQAAVAVLNEERSKLVRQLAQLGATPTGELTGDVEFGDGFADAAAATAERSEVIGIAENLASMLESVDAALAKVAAGSYGSCEACGLAIPATRLEFRPTSRYCVDCKAKLAS